jgi:hypothetical protein
MTNRDSSSKVTSIATPPAALFKPFEWVAPWLQHGPYNMLSDVRDLAAGVAVALQMVERSSMDKENGTTPLLDTHNASCLTRMSIAAMRSIAERIDAHFDDNMIEDRCAEAGSQQGVKA